MKKMKLNTLLFVSFWMALSTLSAQSISSGKITYTMDVGGDTPASNLLKSVVATYTFTPYASRLDVSILTGMFKWSLINDDKRNRCLLLAENNLKSTKSAVWLDWAEIEKHNQSAKSETTIQYFENQTLNVAGIMTYRSEMTFSDASTVHIYLSDNIQVSPLSIIGRNLNGLRAFPLQFDYSPRPGLVLQMSAKTVTSPDNETAWLSTDVPAGYKLTKPEDYQKEFGSLKLF